VDPITTLAAFALDIAERTDEHERKLELLKDAFLRTLNTVIPTLYDDCRKSIAELQEETADLRLAVMHLQADTDCRHDGAGTPPSGTGHGDPFPNGRDILFLEENGDGA